MNLKIEFARKMSLAYTAVCRPLCQEMKLPQTAFDILMFLYNNPEYKTARDIVEIRNIKANLVSVNVEKLVQDGYIERQAVEKDRRNYEHIIHHECRKSLVFVQHIELLSIPTVRCRIATLLLSLCSSVGEDCEEGLRIPLRLTHQQIADIVHSDRVTVARIISELVKNALVTKVRRCLILVDVNHLCNLAMGLA